MRASDLKAGDLIVQPGLSYTITAPARIEGCLSVYWLARDEWIKSHRDIGWVTRDLKTSQVFRDGVQIHPRPEGGAEGA